jgi:hypothetical protein
MNILDWLGRSDYRMHVHSQSLVDELILEAGLERRYHHAGRIWQTAVYARVRPGAQPG